MNKVFIKKMIMAEKLKYEAIKEILPKDVKENLEEFEKGALSLLKEVALEIINEEMQKEESKKIVKKVDIDFTN
ncbi:hypothetical protein [Alkaliphilus peptidifermentans]|uniref:Uncharacterized protein n=1 Tax=Alkaliphilus peptidifermentans DSM 18978 TaxID=1120976 RepID=A0A1G5KUY1_9FIRM|nr:hypothetical protein [Alkaliphilus peptidifermentans]SCZ03951.1 hypothetical protein SAMN03080606_03766 [Alkaliphilus peptidifermentans DSM 18978]